MLFFRGPTDLTIKKEGSREREVRGERLHTVAERFWFLPSCSSAIPSGILMVRAG